MNKPIHLSSLLFLLVVGFCLAATGTQPQQAADEQAASADTGRDNPFAWPAEKPRPDISPQPGKQLPPVEAEKPSFCQDCNVETVTLKFLKAESLKSAVGNMSSKYGSISIDAGSNSLIVSDTNDNLPKIIAAIRNADKTPKQIMIEVVILDVKLSDDTTIGVDWDILTDKNYGFAYRQSMVGTDRFIAQSAPTTDIGDLTNYQTIGTGLGGELAVVSSTVRNVLHLLQETTDVEILASPRVMVVSGQQAEIKTVEEIPYTELTQSSGGGGSSPLTAITSTQFKETGVTLDVKATITNDGKILLVIKPKQSVSVGTNTITGNTEVPIIDTREASTTLLIDDNQVVIMGGLREQNTQIKKNKIPLLGDLPLIGILFSKNEKIAENSELLVLLSPHIYKDEPVSDEEMAKFNVLRSKPILSMPDTNDHAVFLNIPADSNQRPPKQK
jgi:type II secretory pathway component GspD/PulD (secretin)